VFTKDLEQLTADLEAVIEWYRDALVAKCEGFDQILTPLSSHIRKFGQALERLRRMEEADGEAELTTVHDRQIGQ